MPENQKGAVYLLLPLLIITIGIIGLSVTSKITTTTNFSSSQVLGEDETAQKAAEQAKESAQQSFEQSKESAQKELEQQKESANTKVEVQSEGQKSETEIETASGQKIKTKVEDNGAVKVEIEQGKQKVKFEEKNGEVNLETENETEASESANKESELEELRSISKFPLRIATASNQLIMTKDGIDRVLTVLPEKAVQGMLRAHLKKSLGPKFFEATGTGELVVSDSAEITVLRNQISLEEENGQVVYKIPAQKHLKLLGLVPITTDTIGFVSTETGSIIKEQESLLSKILDLLSP